MYWYTLTFTCNGFNGSLKYVFTIIFFDLPVLFKSSGNRLDIQFEITFEWRVEKLAGLTVNLNFFPGLLLSRRVFYPGSFMRLTLWAEPSSLRPSFPNSEGCHLSIGFFLPLK